MNTQKLKDPVGWPDFTYPVTIAGQTLYIAVDIIAQTIPSLNINISSISSGVTFEVSIVDSTVTLNVNVTNSNLNVNVTNAFINAYITNSTITVQVTGTVNVHITDSTLNVNITNASLNVNVTNAFINAYITNSTITVQVTGTVNVNVTNSTLTVQITGTPTINVQTSSGANIVIDKLTTGAYTDNRITIQNNGTTPIMGSIGTTARYGKYFPRGCRGHIDRVYVYCANNDTYAHYLYINISVQPGMAPIISTTLTVPAGGTATWRYVLISKFWNYDSMFIWLSADHTDWPTVGYDTGTPYDCYISIDGITWGAWGQREWIYVGIAGGTVGDLPISGTVNTIEIPRSSSQKDSGSVTVPSATEVTLISVDGSGHTISVLCTFESNLLTYRVYCDGVLTESVYPAFLENWGFTASTPGLSLLYYSTAEGKFTIWDTRQFSFTRKLEIKVYNADATSHSAHVYAQVSTIK